MNRFVRSEAGAVVLWVLGSLLLGAVFAPWLHRAGMALADAAQVRELPGVLESIGASAARAKFGRFFSRAMTAAAVLLLPVLFWRIRRIPAAALPAAGRTAYGWRRGLLQTAAGVVIAAGLLWAMGALVHSLGAFTAKPEPPAAGKWLGKVLVPALSASLVEEWLFRGVVLGLWLRFARPLWACLGVSLFFAFVHFLEPPAGSVIADPASPLAGFQLLGMIFGHFADPLFFVTDFATLFVIGVILAWSRLRTGALWFPIGLHAGWILAFKGFNLLYRQVPVHPLHPWVVGNSLKVGLLPLLTLLLTAVLCHYAHQRIRPLSRASR